FPGGSAALAGVRLLTRGAALLVLANSVPGTGIGFRLTIAHFALATNNVPHDTLLHQAVPTSRRSSVLSVQSLVFYVGRSRASGPLGWLASLAGPGAPLHHAGLATIRGRIASACSCRLQASAEPVPGTVARTAEQPVAPRLAEALLGEGS